MLIASYTLTSRDKRALFMEKKSKKNNADGIVKALTSIRLMKQDGERALKEATAISESEFTGSSRTYSKSRSRRTRSSGSRGSRRKNKSTFVT